MSSSSQPVDYDTLATTSIKEITEDGTNQDILRSLKKDELSTLWLSAPGLATDVGEYELKYCSDESLELGWLGHFMKKSKRLESFVIDGGDIVDSCSEHSVNRFLDDLGKCNHIQQMSFYNTDLDEIIYKLVSAMKSNNITHLVVRRCYLGIPGAIFLFNTLHDLNSLEQLWIDYQDNRDNAELNDAIMAECILTLSACTGMQKLTLNGLNLSTNSFAVLRTVFPRMSALLDLGLCGNLIDDVCARDLVHGLSKCTHLQRLSLSRNIISDNGLDVLIQGLPKSVDKLHVEGNDVTLARQVPLLRFKNLFLSGNTLCLDGPGLIAASLANPECRLESLTLTQCNIGDEEAATLADGLRNNRRLTRMSLANNSLANNNITKEGWNAFSSILCDSSSIIATYNSNHTLQSLGLRGFVSQDIEMMLDQNRLQDKSRVAANKILLAHRHLDMSPLFGSELDLLPRVVAWLDRFAKSRPDLKLSSIFEFVRAMPMKVTARLLGMAEGKKRKPSN